jgi:hypothetical protein
VLTITIDQLEETTLLSSARLILIEKSQFLLVELLEKIVPGNAFQGVFPTVAGKINSQYAGLSTFFGIGNRSRITAALFDPFADILT